MIIFFRFLQQLNLKLFSLSCGLPRNCNPIHVVSDVLRDGGRRDRGIERWKAQRDGGMRLEHEKDDMDALIVN